MKKPSVFFLATGLATAIGVGVAYADMQGNMHGDFHHNMMKDMMERYDANKDGKISQAEIDQNRAQRLGEFDADKSAALSLEEFSQLWLKAQHRRMVREFQEFDVDGNAQVTLDEYSEPMASMVERMDVNGDGAMSGDDRVSPHHRMKGKRYHQRMKMDREDGGGDE
jgi:Ca2+-binding EF-hand superfamily protein